MRNELAGLLEDEKIFIDDDLKRRLCETPRITGNQRNVFSEDDFNRVHLYVEYFWGLLNGREVLRGRIKKSMIVRLVYLPTRNTEDYDI